MNRSAEDSLKFLKDLAKKYRVQGIANEVFNNPKFTIWPASASRTNHHYRQGGLVEHTAEVVELCLINNNYFEDNKHSNEMALFLAALFHDVGKMWDYQPKPPEDSLAFNYYKLPPSLYQEWIITDHKLKIHHISRSALEWQKAAVGLDEKIQDEVLHAILSHHGLKEWGSPVQPQTRIAWLLHLCDGISARMDDCDTRTK